MRLLFCSLALVIFSATLADARAKFVTDTVLPVQKNIEEVSPNSAKRIAEVSSSLANKEKPRNLSASTEVSLMTLAYYVASVANPEVTLSDSGVMFYGLELCDGPEEESSYDPSGVFEPAIVKYKGKEVFSASDYGNMFVYSEMEIAENFPKPGMITLVGSTWGPGSQPGSFLFVVTKTDSAIIVTSFFRAKKRWGTVLTKNEGVIQIREDLGISVGKDDSFIGFFL